MENKKVENLNEQKTEKVNDQELENVSGGWIIGDLLEAKVGYESGAYPRFRVGEKVWHLGNADRYAATVIAVSTDKTGIIWKEFTYTVRHEEDGYVDEGVYESALCGRN